MLTHGGTPGAFRPRHPCACVRRCQRLDGSVSMSPAECARVPLALPVRELPTTRRLPSADAWPQLALVHQAVPQKSTGRASGTRPNSATQPATTAIPSSQARACALDCDERSLTTTCAATKPAGTTRVRSRSPRLARRKSSRRRERKSNSRGNFAPTTRKGYRRRVPPRRSFVTLRLTCGSATH
jgi:hypothetical protein